MAMKLASTLACLVGFAAAIPQHQHGGHSHRHDEMEDISHELSLAKPAPSALHFPLSAVKIAPDSLYGIAQQRNLEFQLSLNDTQWLCQMTSAANLTSCVGKCATPGGVGAPPCEQLPGEMGPGGYYGHYQGHYLSGSAMMYNNTGDARIQTKANKLIAEMAKVQAAWAGKVDSYGVPADGYIFPNHPDTFGIMEGRCGMPGPKIDYSVPVRRDFQERLC